MKDEVLASMPEVLRLTRAGRLQEATAAIQRVLGSQATASAVNELTRRAEKSPIEGVFRILNEEPPQPNDVPQVRPARPRPQPVPDRAPDSVPGGRFIPGPTLTTQEPALTSSIFPAAIVNSRCR